MFLLVRRSLVPIGYSLLNTYLMDLLSVLKRAYGYRLHKHMELIILKVFSPVACLNSIKILTSIAVNSGWPFHQLDFKNAYLYGDLTEEVYMQQHP